VIPRPTEATGRKTFGSLLREFFPEHVEKHARFFNERKTWGVDEQRTRFQSLLNDPIGVEEAYRLGMMHDSVKLWLEVASRYAGMEEMPVGERMRRIIKIYKFIRRMGGKR